jgi:hypothetical protein
MRHEIHGILRTGRPVYGTTASFVTQVARWHDMDQSQGTPRTKRYSFPRLGPCGLAPTIPKMDGCN